MEFKGTKGKWKVEINKDYPTTHGIWSNYTYIARTCFAPSSEANALLISKAPEMLDMLKECMRVLGSVQSPATPSLLLYREVENLIKQATEL